VNVGYVDFGYVNVIIANVRAFGRRLKQFEISYPSPMPIGNVRLQT